MTSTGAAAGFFNGALDEARIWNVARSQAQVSATKDLELTSGPGLIARYGLIEGAGTTTASSVAGAPVGTLVNGPFWTAGAPIAPPVNHAAGLQHRHRRPVEQPKATSVSLDADATDADADTLTYSRHRPARRHHHQPSHRRHQRHAHVRQRRHLQRRHHRRPTASLTRHRHLQLDGHQHQPGADLQHRPARPERGRGRHRSARRGRHRSRRRHAHLRRHRPARRPFASTRPRGVISGTLGFGSAGTYNVTVTVTDGTLTPPTPSADGQRDQPESDLRSGPARPDRRRGRPDQPDAGATDPDGDTLTYAATGPARRPVHRHRDRPHQRHDLSQRRRRQPLRRQHHRARRPERRRHRHLQLDGHQHQPGAGVQHRHRQSDRCRGRHAERPRCGRN